MFRVYLDDSGSQEGHEVFAVAGYIAEADPWGHFQRNWDEILAAFNKKYGLAIPYFHMADLVSGNKDFKGVSKLIRSDLLYKLCKLAQARTIMGVGSFVMMEDYIRVLGNPDDLPPGLPTPLTLCAEGATLIAKDVTRRRDSIAFVIEQGSLYRGKLLDGFERARKHPEIEKLFAADSFCQGPRQIAGLQLADLHAWTLAAKQKGGGYRIPDEFRRVVDVFIDEHPHKYWPNEISHLEEGKDKDTSWRVIRLQLARRHLTISISGAANNTQGTI